MNKYSPHLILAAGVLLSIFFLYRQSGAIANFVATRPNYFLNGWLSSSSTKPTKIIPLPFNETLELFSKGDPIRGCSELNLQYNNLSENEKAAAHTVMAMEMLNASEPTALNTGECGMKLLNSTSSPYAIIYTSLNDFINQNYDSALKSILIAEKQSNALPFTHLIAGKMLQAARDRKLEVRADFSKMISAYKTYVKLADPSYPGYKDAIEQIFITNDFNFVIGTLGAHSKKGFNFDKIDRGKAAVMLSDLCYSYLILGRDNEGLAECNKSLTLWRNSAFTLNLMAVVYIHRGKYEEANKYIEEGLALSPNYETLLYNKKRVDAHLKK